MSTSQLVWAISFSIQPSSQQSLQVFFLQSNLSTLPFLLSQETTEQSQFPSLLPASVRWHLPPSLSPFNAAIFSSCAYLLASFYYLHVLYWEAQKWRWPPWPHQDWAEQKTPLHQPAGKRLLGTSAKGHSASSHQLCIHQEPQLCFLQNCFPSGQTPEYSSA